jgi:tRNA nucleotidyltransferase (CCA-adding enzyme)
VNTNLNNSINTVNLNSKVTNMNINLSVSFELTSILKDINTIGGAALLVGGCIRDSLLDINSKDIDIEVYNISFDELVNILSNYGKVDTVGKQFGVTKLTTTTDDYDFAFPRRDNKVGVGYTGFEVEVDSTMSYKEAASRRDFTFNSIMWNPLTGEVIDEFNGVKHLQEGLLVATSDKFAEDPLRVLRAMQFAGRMNLVCDTYTSKLAASLMHEYSFISIERVWIEWYKWATKSVVPSKGIQVLIDSNWLSLFPELMAMKDVPQEPKWHPEGPVLWHTMLVCDAMANICNREGITGEDKAVLIFACLCHDMAKPTTTVVVEGVIKSPGHEKEGELPTRSFLASIGCPNKIIDRVVPLVVRHLAHLSCQSKKAVRRLAEALYPSTIVELGWVIEADQSGRPPITPHMPDECKAMLDIAKNCNCSSGKVLPLITGKHLISKGVKPSKQMGELLSSLFDAQLEGKFNSVDEGLTYFDSIK